MRSTMAGDGGVTARWRLALGLRTPTTGLLWTCPQLTAQEKIPWQHHQHLARRCRPDPRCLHVGAQSRYDRRGHVAQLEAADAGEDVLVEDGRVRLPGSCCEVGFGVD